MSNLGPIHIDHIRRDGGTQMRVSLNEDVILSYAERLEAGDKFPPIVVFRDEKGAHWLADGFHRMDAHARLRSKHIGTDEENRWAMVTPEIHRGSLQDAVWWSIGANKSNGLRRTNADKQMAVRAALAHPNAKSLSDQAIADQAGVSRVMVLKMREPVTVTGCLQPQTQTNESPGETRTQTRTGVDGKSRIVRNRPPKRSDKERKKREAERVASYRATKSAEKSAAEPTLIDCPHCGGTGKVRADG